MPLLTALYTILKMYSTVLKHELVMNACINDLNL